MNPALETLLLAFAGDDGFAAPSRALFLGAEPHPVLKEWPTVLGWQPHKPLADAWERAGFERCDAPDGSWPVVLHLPGKSRDEVLAGFHRAWALLEPGGKLVAAMANGAGAARFEKELAAAAAGVESRQKNKCRVFSVTKTSASLPDAWEEAGVRRRIPGTAFVTEAGVFSAGRIDPGSQMLADVLPKTLRGKVADLGAGWGFLSDAVLRCCAGVKQLDLYESDARALDCARENLADHERNLQFLWHDVAVGVNGRYDAIVMNPPFHVGKAQDVGLGRAFLKSAAAALHPGGQLWMVANRHLPYEAALDACGLRRTQETCDQSYKVIKATR